MEKIIFSLFDNQNMGSTLLKNAGAKEVVSCNTIFHPSNQIDIVEILLEGVKSCEG